MSNATNAATFLDNALAYRAARPTYPAALFDWLAAQVPQHDAAWDIGCGSGQATGALAARFARVIANDPAGAALAEAQRVLPTLTNVTWREAPAEAMALPPQSLDLAVAASSFHWLDHAAFFDVLLPALRPHGVFAAVAYGSTQMADDLHALVRQAFAPLQPFWADGNRALWRGYQDLPFPLDVIDAPTFIIELNWTLDQYLAYAATWSAYRRWEQETSASRTLDLLTDARALLAPRWGAGTQRIVLPLTLKVGRRPRSSV